MISTPIPSTEVETFARATPSDLVIAQTLTDAHRDEVLSFLAERPLEGLFLRGHVEDNGLVSSANRGRFVGVRDPFGYLEGVALIGHATLFEARSENALAALAKSAQQSEGMHMLLGEERKVGDFWKFYAKAGKASRACSRSLLFNQTEPGSSGRGSSSLRLAKPEHLNLLTPVHAEMAFEESGINPLETDPEGFRTRYLSRIQRDRVWIVTEGDRLAFKAEVALQTSDAIYLEGIHLHPDLRGAGHGHRYLSELVEILFRRARSICMLVNENNLAAHGLYRKAGFTFKSYYQTIFLDTVNAPTTSIS